MRGGAPATPAFAVVKSAIGLAASRERFVHVATYISVLYPITVRVQCRTPSGRTRQPNHCRVCITCSILQSCTKFNTVWHMQHTHFTTVSRRTENART